MDVRQQGVRRKGLGPRGSWVDVGRYMNITGVSGPLNTRLGVYSPPKVKTMGP